VALLTVIARYRTEAGLRWPVAALAAVAIGLGLVATRLVERLGRPRAVTTAADEDWVPLGQSAESRSWSSTAATTTPGGLWASDDAWGTADRR
jgi:hypothetical protein